jgi:putative transcriptional regulator
MRSSVEWQDRGHSEPQEELIRCRPGLDQAEFARRFRIDLDALKGWEQGWAFPTTSARVYLRVIDRNPDVVAGALED